MNILPTYTRLKKGSNLLKEKYIATQMARQTHIKLSVAPIKSIFKDVYLDKTIINL